MTVLLRMFLTQLLKTALQVFAAVIVMAIAVHKAFGVPYSAMLPGLVVGCYCIIFSGHVLGLQSSWVVLQPLRKRAVLALGLIFGFAMTAAVMFTLFAIVLSLSVADSGGLQLFSLTIKSVLNQIHGLWNKMGHSLCYGIASLTAGPFLLLSIWVSPIGGIRGKTYQGAAIGRPAILGSKQRRKWLLTLLGTVLAAAMLQDFIFCGAGVFVFGEVAAAGIFIGLARNLGLSGAAFRRWRNIVIALAGAQAVLVGAAVLSGLKSGVLDCRVEARIFLGPWARWDRDSLAEILKSDCSFENVKKFGKIYKSIDPEMEKVSFSDLIRSKSDNSSLNETIKLFPVNRLSADDVVLLLDHVDRIGKGYSRWSYEYEMIPANISPEQMIGLINSPKESEREYGILRARYRRDPAYVAPLLKLLGEEGTKEKYAVRDTLAYLTGVQWDDDFYAAWKYGRKKTEIRFVDSKCEGFHGRSITDLHPDEEGMLNICLHEALERKGLTFSEIDHKCWVKIPVQSSCEGDLKTGLEMH